MSYFGYSTGAIALGDFTRALDLLAAFSFEAIELSALRIGEVEPLVAAIPRLDLSRYSYVSFHAPSSFNESDEAMLVDLLKRLPRHWPIILHPDAIYDIELWRGLSPRLAIENMDRRKGMGRSVAELSNTFKSLPEARMCLDLGHARQVDSSMVGAYQLLRVFASRIVQLHISEVDTFNRHDVISKAAELAFMRVKRYLPTSVAYILESRVDESQIQSEANKVERMFAKQHSREKAPPNQVAYA